MPRLCVGCHAFAHFPFAHFPFAHFPSPTSPSPPTKSFQNPDKTRRYAALLNATVELSKAEGMVFDPRSETLYVAMSSVRWGAGPEGGEEGAGPEEGAGGEGAAGRWGAWQPSLWPDALLCL